MGELLIDFDHWLFHLINLASANPFFDWLMPLVSSKSFWLIPILISLGLLFFLGKKRGKIAALLVILTIATADPVCARILKPTFKRIRPSHALSDVRLVGKKGGKYGFPSNHAANVTGAMTILFFFYRRYKYLFGSLSLVVGYSRIYLGVHYPADVIVGMLIGGLVALAWILIWQAIANHLMKKENDLLILNS
ncbi:MAG: phosphatase PAP2 family protein [Candidatus Neomarinimicrobiota bacterium]